jgi:hypothetical protein
MPIQKHQLYFSPLELKAVQVGLETLYADCKRSLESKTIDWKATSRTTMIEIQNSALNAGRKICKITGTPFNVNLEETHGFKEGDEKEFLNPSS